MPLYETVEGDLGARRTHLAAAEQPGRDERALLPRAPPLEAVRASERREELAGEGELDQPLDALGRDLRRRDGLVRGRPVEDHRTLGEVVPRARAGEVALHALRREPQLLPLLGGLRHGRPRELHLLDAQQAHEVAQVDDLLALTPAPVTGEALLREDLAVAVAPEGDHHVRAVLEAELLDVAALGRHECDLDHALRALEAGTPSRPRELHLAAHELLHVLVHIREDVVDEGHVLVRDDEAVRDRVEPQQRGVGLPVVLAGGREEACERLLALLLHPDLGQNGPVAHEGGKVPPRGAEAHLARLVERVQDLEHAVDHVLRVTAVLPVHHLDAAGEGEEAVLPLEVALGDLVADPLEPRLAPQTELGGDQRRLALAADTTVSVARVLVERAAADADGDEALLEHGVAVHAAELVATGAGVDDARRAHARELRHAELLQEPDRDDVGELRLRVRDDRVDRHRASRRTRRRGLVAHDT